MKSSTSADVYNALRQLLGIGDDRHIKRLTLTLEVESPATVAIVETVEFVGAEMTRIEQQFELVPVRQPVPALPEHGVQFVCKSVEDVSCLTDESAVYKDRRGYVPHRT